MITKSAESKKKLLVIIHSVPDEAVRPKQLSCSIILVDHRTISGD